MWLILLLIVTPLIEIGVFIQVGGLIGLWPTLACVILTAILGGALLRYQGFQVIQRLQASAQRGETPMRALFDGACLLVAGAVLLTPGFVTDAFGFLLFLPPVRSWLAKLIWEIVKRRAQMRMSAGFGPGGGPGRQQPGTESTVIEGEFEEVDPGDRPGPPRP